MSRDRELGEDDPAEIAPATNRAHPGPAMAGVVAAHFDAIDDRIEALYETALRPRIDALEASRLKVRRGIVQGLVVLGVPVVLFFLSDAVATILALGAGGSAFLGWLLANQTAVSIWLFLLALAYVAVVLAAPGVTAYLNYRHRFKQELIAEVVRALEPAWSYQPDHHVTRAVFESSGIWTHQATFSGDDLVRGRIGTTEFEASDLRGKGDVVFQRRRRRETMTREPNVTVFQGLFVHLGLDRAVRGHTIVEPERADGRSLQKRDGFEQIRLGDPAFDGLFRVYATDAVSAAELLGPRVRELLVALADHLSRVPFAAVVGNHAFVAVHTGVPMFEPTIRRPASYGSLAALGELIGLPTLLARELTRAEPGIGAAAPAAILAQAPAAGFAASAFAGKRSDGPGAALTVDDIANLAMPAADEKDLALRPPPESRVRVTPLTGEGLTVSYGLAPGFFMRGLWTLALAPFALAGAARLAGQAGHSMRAAIVEQIPLAAVVAEWAALWPVTFIGVVLVFFVLPTRALMLYPSGLHVGREGVRVSRRLWPLSVLYPLDRLAGVRVSDKQVALQRRNASLLRRYYFPAPPMPTGEHARWLAAHLRRALMMFGVREGT